MKNVEIHFLTSRVDPAKFSTNYITRTFTFTQDTGGGVLETLGKMTKYVIYTSTLCFFGFHHYPEIKASEVKAL